MTDKEQADYNKAFTKAFQMHVCGVDEEDIKLFIEDSHKYSDEIGEGYTALADADGMFWSGYELGLKHAKERCCTRNTNEGGSLND